MTNIKCDVHLCKYNDSNRCQASDIDIGEGGVCYTETPVDSKEEDE